MCTWKTNTIGLHAMVSEMNTNKPLLFQNNSSRLLKKRRRRKSKQTLRKSVNKTATKSELFKMSVSPIGSGFKNIHIVL